MKLSDFILAICITYLVWYNVLREEKKPKCHPIGYTLIEYGKAVTSCGDTITIQPPKPILPCK